MLFIENTLGRDITVFDEQTFERRGVLSLGKDILPDDICASPDGRILYANGAYAAELCWGIAGATSDHSALVSDYDGKLAAAAGDLKSRLHLMAGDRSVFVAFDTQTLKEIWRVDIRGHVGHLAITPDGRYVYNALFDTFFVARVDTQTRAVDYIPVPVNGGHGMCTSRDGSRVYVGSILMGELDVIDVETSLVAQRVLFPDNVRPFAVTADNRWTYVQNSRFHGFHVVDLERNKIVRSVALPPLPPGTPVIEAFPHTVDHGMILTPDETRLLALATTGNYVAIYSHPKLELLGTVPIGVEPSWIITDAKGEYAYCSNRVSDDVSVVSIADLTEVKRFHAGYYPQRMWATADVAAAGEQKPASKVALPA